MVYGEMKVAPFQDRDIFERQGIGKDIYVG
jgi:hypothetical protein